MPRRRPVSRTWGILLAFALIQACGGATPTPSPTSSAAAATAPPTAGPERTDAPPTEAPATATAAPDAEPPAESSLPGAAYVGMPISLEMFAGCGLCGPTYWLYELPRFRLYADGLAVFRGPGEDRATAPYRYARLDDDDFEDLLSAALDEGGLRGAGAHYPGNADDAGEIRLALHAQFFDPAADVDVEIEPLIGSGTLDRFGEPIKDLPRRERLEAFAAMLGDFDAWLAARDVSSEPFEPEAYTAALHELYPGGASGPWPWSDVQPEAFGAAGSGVALARITPTQALGTGVSPGGDEVSRVPFGEDMAGTLFIRPILPGDDRPGMFGLRPDMAALAVEPDLRVRSLPEVSDASVKLTPLLREGDSLFVIDGPVAGSDYAWYEVHAPRAGLTGWVAAASKSGEDWIRPVPLECDHDDEIDLGGSDFDLMALACYGDRELTSQRLLARPEDDGLRCPDTFEWFPVPEWIGHPLMCGYAFESVDTGGIDHTGMGVLHPSIAGVPEELLGGQPSGLLVDVRGRFDHPDVRDCTADGSNVPPPALVRLGCRATFVITALQPAR